jgi:hypothetical protein
MAREGLSEFLEKSKGIRSALSEKANAYYQSILDESVSFSPARPQRSLHPNDNKIEEVVRLVVEQQERRILSQRATKLEPLIDVPKYATLQSYVQSAVHRIPMDYLAKSGGQVSPFKVKLNITRGNFSSYDKPRTPSLNSPTSRIRKAYESTPPKSRLASQPLPPSYPKKDYLIPASLQDSRQLKGLFQPVLKKGKGLKVRASPEA